MQVKWDNNCSDLHSCEDKWGHALTLSALRAKHSMNGTLQMLLQIMSLQCLPLTWEQYGCLAGWCPDASQYPLQSLACGGSSGTPMLTQGPRDQSPSLLGGHSHFSSSSLHLLAGRGRGGRTRPLSLLCPNITHPAFLSDLPNTLC